MRKQYSKKDIQLWAEDGAFIFDSLFTSEEVQAVHDDIKKIFKGKKGRKPIINKAEDISITVPEQFLNFDNIPFNCSPALNLIGLHPQLMQIAKDALRTNDIRLYQSQAWAKFAGEADFDQSFHCDYGNHTLTVPSNNIRQNSITFLMYFSDVTEQHGPTHYVAKSDIQNEHEISKMFLDSNKHEELQILLKQNERSVTGPAGTVFAYGIDVFHRATNIVCDGGYRFAVTSCFKKADNDSIGFTAWPFHQHKPWHIIFEHGSPTQLNCFGVPLPGDPFWNEITLELAGLRYPKWDLTKYIESAF